jgi:hypothetical protein
MKFNLFHISKYVIHLLYDVPQVLLGFPLDDMHAVGGGFPWIAVNAVGRLCFGK